METKKCKIKMTGNTCFLSGKFGFKTYCKDNKICEHKQFIKLQKENEKIKKCLDKIRDIELEELDIDWDEYKATYQDTDFSSIVTYCEIGLGEQDDV